MADKFAGGIIAGSTSLDIPVLLRVKSDGAEMTGKVATAVVAYYWRQSAVSAIEITCVTLGSLGAAYAAGGWYEVGSIMPGAYRLCVPNTALSTGADWVAFGVKDTAASGFMFYEKYHLATGVYLADDAITSAKVAAGAFTYDDQITTFKSELSGLIVGLPNGHITSAKIGADAIGSDKVGAGAFVYGDQITVFDASIKSAASAAWADAAATVRVVPAVGSITNAVYGTDVLTAAVFAADFLTSAKVAAGAFTYDDQITTFKSELSGMVVSIPDGHLTAAKIGADAITSAKVAAGAFTYDDQITTFKSELSGMAITIPNDHITSAKVAAGAFTYDDQITTFKSEISGVYSRLTTLGVRDITQYTSAQGGIPGSSPALIDAIYWMNANMAYTKIQTPTTYLVHNAAGAAIASAPVSGNSTSVTIGIFSNV